MTASSPLIRPGLRTSSHSILSPIGYGTEYLLGELDVYGTLFQIGNIRDSINMVVALLTPVLGWITSCELLESSAEVVCMNVAQFVGDFFYRHSVFLQQLPGPFHASAGMIFGHRFRQMCPEQAIERCGRHLQVFTKRRYGISLSPILGKPSQGQLETQDGFSSCGVGCLESGNHYIHAEAQFFERKC